MKSVFKLVGIIAIVVIIGFSMAACDDNSGGGDNSGGPNIPSQLIGAWYNGTSNSDDLLFIIDNTGTGIIGSQSGYSVTVLGFEQGSVPKSGSGSVSFKQGSTETGQFQFMLNGDGVMWIQSGTGPFAAWANIAKDPTRPYVIQKTGTFTLTDIPATYNGKYAVLLAENPATGDYDLNLWGYIGNDNTWAMILPQISGGKVVIPLWQHPGWWYSGNDTYVTDNSIHFLVKLVNNRAIKNLDEPGDAVFFSSVTFSGGSAKKSYNDRRK